VATGIVLEFSFGTNWSNYSRMVGDIFGAPLAAEGITSFFLESVFLGVLIFGREKVSKRTYLVSVFLVFFASHLSGLWIIIANSWMQTPAGFAIEGGRAVLTDFFAAALNGSTLIRYFHTVLGGWITGSLLVSGISAWYLIRKRDQETARLLLGSALWIFIFASLIQLGSGHAHSVQVARTQPAKMAAFEALWETRTGAPMALFGVPDDSSRTTHLSVAVPGLLSIAIHFDPNAEVTGLGDFPKDEQPPVAIPFYSYHGMITMGSYFILMSLIAIFLLYKDTLHETRWYLWLLMVSSPLPLVANELGWIAAEVGRQPWAVYNILKTSNAASVVVPAWQILFSIIMFSAIYLLLFSVFLMLLLKIIREGPDNVKLGYIGE
jgi:cytochrome bd ubiquinol oxidase subunit I